MQDLAAALVGGLLIYIAYQAARAGILAAHRQRRRHGRRNH